MSTVIKINSSNRQKVEQDLMDRFYVEKQHGNHKEFYDTKRGTGAMLSGALYTIAMQRLDSGSWEEARKLINEMHWRTLSKPNVYRPQEDLVVCDDDHIYSLNLWQPPQLTSDGAGDPYTFIAHLELVLGSAEKASYLLDILAWRHQNPKDNKPAVAFYFYGATGGAGKSTFAETLKLVLGKSAVKVLNTVEAVTTKGAVDCWNCSFLVVEEANVKHGGGKTYDTLKSYTGSDTVEADAKHMAFREYEIPAMLVMLSNRAPTFIEPDDRRFYVSEWMLDMDDQEKATYFVSYRDWLENQGGYEAIARHLKTRVVTRNVYEPVPVTPEKSRAMVVAANPVTVKIMDMLEDNKDKLLFTGEIFEAFFRDNHVATGVQKHLLSDAGIELLEKRTLVKGKQMRLWARRGVALVSTVGKATQVEYKGELQPVNAVLMQMPPEEF